MNKDHAALIISITALLFTIFSFWWMNWRRGRLKVSNIRTYAASSAGKKVLVELPLIFFNTGALPILIENIRLILKYNVKEELSLHFNATVAKLATDYDRAWATPFAVHGGKAMEVICEFQTTNHDFVFAPGDYTLALEALLGHKKGWRHLRDFPIRVNDADSINMNRMLKAYDNRFESV